MDKWKGEKWKGDKWKRIMQLAMFSGLLVLAVAIGLVLFTDLLQQGIGGVTSIGLTFGLGLLLLIPSKLFLTLLLMQQKQR